MALVIHRVARLVVAGDCRASIGSGAFFQVALFRSIPASKNSLISLVARLVSLVITLTISAIASRVFTGEEFGLWAIFQSIFLLLQNMDLGLRYGLGNRLAAFTAESADARPPGSARQVYYAVFNLLLVWGAVMGAVAFLVARALPWDSWFGVVQSDLASTIPGLMGWAGLVLCISLPWAMVPTVLFAAQEIAAASVIAILNAAVMLLALMAAMQGLSFQATVMVYFVSNLVFSAGATAWLWKRRGWSWEWGGGPSGQLRTVGGFLRPSLRFFVLTIASSLSGFVGTWVCGAAFGLVVAGHFSLLQRIFSLLNTVHIAVLGPAGPEYTRLAQGGNWDELARRHKRWRRLLLPGLFLVAGGLLWAAHPWMLKLWSGLPISDYTLAALIWLWVALIGWVGHYSVLLNSLGLVGFQGVYSLVMMLPSALIPYYLAGQWGGAGVALGLVLCALPAAIIWPRMARNALERRLLEV